MQYSPFSLILAVEELAIRFGQTIGGLLVASFGNATELIIAIIALVDGQLRVVQVICPIHL